MNADKRQKSAGKRRGPNSRILDALDVFCDAVYDRLTGGVFGTLLSKYPDAGDTLFGRFCASGTRKKVFTPARRAVASRLETSAFARLYARLISFLLTVRLKVYGSFVFSFLIYTAVFSAIGLFRGRGGDLTSVVIPAVLGLGELPAFFSDKTLAQAICTSYIGRLLLRVTGIKPERLDVVRRSGRGDLAFVAALVFGLATIKVPFWAILCAPLALAFVALIFSSPEFGTVCLFFFAPLLPSTPLFVMASVTIASFLLKALLAKRVFRIEAIDMVMFPLVCVFTVGALWGASPMSYKGGSAIVVFMCCYYLTVFTLVTREWLRRAVVALLVSCTCVSFIGMGQYVWQTFNGTVAENGWVDESMFGFITGRAFSTLENPNMLSVYLILVFPIAFGALIVMARGVRQRALAFTALAATGICLLLTWSRGAWLGLMLAMIVFIMIWSRRSIYVFVCGVLAVPFLPYVVPDGIWTRFTSIGNLADSSSQFRVIVLKSAAGLLPRYLMNGLGLGEESWYLVWPANAVTDVQWTAHSHNLYLQIWLQTGLVSLILFIVLILFLFLANFNFYSRLKNTDEMIMSHISLVPVKDHSARVETAAPEVSAEKKKTTMRIEAAAPLCGVLAALLMGFTDYVLYNFRVQLVFWLVCGLSAAFVRVGRRELEYSRAESSPGEAETEIPLEQKKPREKKRGGS